MEPSYELYSMIAYTYCNGVRLSQDTRKYSKAVQVAIFYISRNLHNNINLNQVALSCGYSTRYLFKKIPVRYGHPSVGIHPSGENERGMQPAAHLLIRQ